MQARNTLMLSCAMALIAGYAVIPSAAQTPGGPVREKSDPSVVRKKNFKTSVGTAALRSGSRVKSRPATDGGLAGAPIVNEGFEGFANGAVNGQFGWTTFTAAAAVPVVSTTSPISGTKSVELAKGGIAGGTLNGIFSPLGVQPDGNYIATAKIRIPNTGGADYDIALQSDTLLTSRVKFFFDDADGDTILGDILVADGPAGDFQITGFEYTPGATHTLKVVLDSTNSQQRYYLDSTLIWVGSVWGGAVMEQAVLFSDSFQLTGEIGRVDDVVVEPGVQALCPGNANGDAAVNVTDLLAVISAWGACVDCLDSPCPADFNADCSINVTDLLTVISGWGACQQAPTGACCTAGTCTGPVTFLDCIAGGGVFQGGSVDCADVTCTIPQLNDECANAAVITPVIGTPFTQTVTVADFTTNGTDPDTTCEIGGGGPFAKIGGWWYIYTAPASGVSSITVATCTTALDNDAVVSVYTGACGTAPLVGWTSVGCDDDTCNVPGVSDPNFGSATVTVPVTGGTTYRIFIDNYSGGDFGPTVDVTITVN